MQGSGRCKLVGRAPEADAHAGLCPLILTIREPEKARSKADLQAAAIAFINLMPEVLPSHSPCQHLHSLAAAVSLRLN